MNDLKAKASRIINSGGLFYTIYVEKRAVGRPKKQALIWPESVLLSWEIKKRSIRKGAKEEASTGAALLETEEAVAAPAYQQTSSFRLGLPSLR